MLSAHKQLGLATIDTITSAGRGVGNILAYGGSGLHSVSNGIDRTTGRIDDHDLSDHVNQRARDATAPRRRADAEERRQGILMKMIEFVII